jgi:ComF family protein
MRSIRGGMLDSSRSWLEVAARSSAARTLARAARELERTVADFVLPSLCPGCGVGADPLRLLCEPCRASIPRLSIPLCARCLAREGHPVGCLAHPDHAVWSAWVYDERAALVVQALKYQDRPRLAESLGAELAHALPTALDADAIVELPLHRARERERGYNQAARLADALSFSIGVPRLPRAVARVRATRPQARLGARARRRNVAGAFRVERPDCMKGRRVLVVDDVMTTGATLEACLGALARAGAHPIGVTLAWAQ